jgi:uracil-DNA glycosylase
MNSMPDVINIPESWREVLQDELRQPYFSALAQFVAEERQNRDVFPSAADLYSALRHTPYENVTVLLLGQDPYHDIGQAHGMCFSVRAGTPPPPSLVNIFKELKSDLGIEAPSSGCLTKWADQGVLLLNTVLTVRAHEPQSHKGRGWEQFTDAIIRKVAQKREPVIFVLWGASARKKEPLIDSSRHTILKSAHPSPLSARNGFFGSRPFSRINAALREAGKREIDWRL